jgi:type IV pilus assembly protein PilQ
VVNFPFTTTEPSLTGAALGMTFANIANTFALDIQLSAAEQNNDLRIVSNPRILTMDNTPALIKSGVEVPFQTVEDKEVKIEFKEAVIQLEVTPHVVSEDLVHLDITVKKDEVDTLRTVDGNPFFLKKEAHSRILMRDGETLVIGGLSKDRKGRAERGVPWLSKIPLLKHLFGHSRNLQEFEEIVVFITPRVAPSLVSESGERTNAAREGGLQ